MKITIEYDDGETTTFETLDALGQRIERGAPFSIIATHPHHSNRFELSIGSDENPITGKVIGMTIFKGDLIVAGEKGVFVATQRKDPRGRSYWDFEQVTLNETLG